MSRAPAPLPVLLPAGPTLHPAEGRERWSPQPRHLLAAGLVFTLVLASAQAQTATGQASPLTALIRWAPFLLSGFAFNLAISIIAMVAGTALGLPLGIAQISLLPPVRATSWFATQLFRNAPWLVLLFFMMFLLPFQFQVGDLRIPFPDWVKATIGLALPVMANVSEIVRGAIQSIPSGQWEAAESLSFTRRQILWMIILPQCVKRMLPPWMNLYSILTMGTVLASVVGVNEMLTLTQQALASENRAELLAPFYGFDLVVFFLYCYPIARWTVRLERRFRVRL